MNTQKLKPTNSQFTEEFITNHADIMVWYYITKNIVRCTHFSDELCKWRKNWYENGRLIK